MATKTNNYTLGRGELYFAPFTDAQAKTLAPGGGFRFLGNVPTFALTINSTSLDHYQSTGGVKEKDLTIPLQTDRTATITAEDISVENLAAFFMGSTSTIAAVAGTDLSEDITGAKPGHLYQLGISDANPTGIRNVTGLALTIGDGETAATLVEGVDMNTDAMRGTIEFIEGGKVTDDGSVTVHAAYGNGASTRTQVISGSDSVAGALKFVAHNAAGEDIDYYMPYVTLAPNGQFSLIADTLQQIPLNVSVLVLAGKAALYADGAAVAGV